MTFTKGSTKGRGPGKFYSVSTRTGSGRKLYKFLSEENFNKLNTAYRGRKSTARKSACRSYKSGKPRRMKSCMKSPRCSWIKAKRTRSGKVKRSAYCRKKSTRRKS